MKGRRLLKQYLKETGQSVVELARRSGLHNAMLYRYLHGQRRPDGDSRERLAKATKGAVPASAWATA